MNRWIPRLVSALILLLFAVGLGSVQAAGEPSPPLPPACQKLSAAKQAKARALLAKIHPYECCDRTLAECAKKKPCALVDKLSESVCRRVGAGQDDAVIERAINRRGASMPPMAKLYSIDMAGLDLVGEASSPATVVAYVCPRCPYCAKMIQQLYREVTSGALKGKVRLAVKLFPLRSHADSVPGAKALMAAQRMGRFWPFLLRLYSHFDEYEPSKLPTWAAETGLERERFVQLMSDPSLRKALVASKKEGVRNGVEATPALYIEGRRYQGELEIGEVVDVLDEVYRRKTGKLCQ